MLSLQSRFNKLIPGLKDCLHTETIITTNTSTIKRPRIPQAEANSEKYVSFLINPTYQTVNRLTK